MALVDQAAAVAAIRHAGGPAVTASIDRVDFRERIPVGALVTCRDGGLRRQQLDGHHGRGVCRDGEHRRAAAHPHRARGLRRDRRDGEAQAGAAADSGDGGRAGAVRTGARRTGSRAQAVSGGPSSLVLSGGGAKAAAHVGARARAAGGGAQAGAVRGHVDGRGDRGGSGRGPRRRRPAGPAGSRPGGSGIVRARLARCAGSSPGAAHAGGRSAGRSSGWCLHAASLTCSVPLTVSAADLDSGELHALRRRRRGRAAARRALRHLRPAALLPAVTVGGRRLGDGGLRGVLPLAVGGRDEWTR